MDPLSRRTVIGACAGVAAGLSGCLSEDTDDDPNDEFRAETEREVDLSDLRLVNHADEAHDVNVLVEHAAAFVHWATYEVEPASAGGGATIDVSLPDDPGETVVHVRVGDEFTSAPLAERYGGRCARVMGVVGTDGSPSVYQGAGECDVDEGIDE
ncbi:hypothetical protein [Natronorarus salvus]|uniref:hypothetical protein n=1 Tax=Natronorarus salvus TaxID=3117733 RepID=UPI002F26058A